MTEQVLKRLFLRPGKTVIPKGPCSCCGGEPSTTAAVGVSQTTQFAGTQTTQSLRAQIPLCSVCATHAAAQRGRRDSAGCVGMLLAAACLIGCGMLAAPYAIHPPPWLTSRLGNKTGLFMLGLAPVGALLGYLVYRVVAALAFRIALRLPGTRLERTSSCTLPARMTGSPSFPVLVCANAAFVDELLTANGGLAGKQETVTLVETARGDLEVPRLSP